MEMYNVRAELKSRKDIQGELVDKLTGYHPAASLSARGWAEVILSFPADNVVQAVTTAAGVIRLSFPHEIVAVEAMTSAEFDARVGFETEAPDVLSVTEAAAELGVSRQAVLKMISVGHLPRMQAGRSYVIPRQAVEARKH